MRDRDWNGYTVPLLVECFNPSAGGCEFKIRAACESEALEKTLRIVQQHYRSFYDKTDGHFQTKFNKILTGTNGHRHKQARRQPS